MMERFLYERIYYFGEKCKIIERPEGFSCKSFCPLHKKCSTYAKDCITHKYYVGKDEIFYK